MLELNNELIAQIKENLDLKAMDINQVQEFCNNLAHKLWLAEHVARENKFNRLISHSNWAYNNSVLAVPNEQFAIAVYGSVKIWDLSKEKIVKRLHDLDDKLGYQQATCLTYIGESRIMVGSRKSNNLNIVNYETGKIEKVIRLDCEPKCTLHIEDSIYAIAVKDDILFLDIKTGFVKTSISPHRGQINALEKLTETISASASDDGLICIWKTWPQVCMLHYLNMENAKSNKAYDVIKFTDTSIATAHDDGIRVWDCISNKCLQHLQIVKDECIKKNSATTKTTSVIKIAKIGEDKLVALYADEKVRIWNTKESKCEKLLSNNEQILVIQNKRH